MDYAFSSRLECVKPASTSKIRNLANELKASGENVINFAAGELDFNPPKFLMDAAIETIQNQPSKYLPAAGLPQLREEISKNISTQAGVQYTKDNVCLTVGAKHALFSIATVLIDPDDEVIIPTPHWGTFLTQVELMGGKVVVADTNAQDYKLTLAQISELVTEKTKAIILNSPNNPSGVTYDSLEIKAIMEFAKNKDIWIISDECYSSLMRNSEEHVSPISLCPQHLDKTIIVNSFSKSYAITGWRIGYLVAPSEVTKKITSLIGHVTSNVSSIAQYTMLQALKCDDGEFIKDVNRELDYRLNIVSEVCKEIDDISYVHPSGGFYVFLDVSSKFGKKYKNKIVNDVSDICEILLKHSGVAVVDGKSFGDSRCIRVSYAVSTDEVKNGMKKIKKVLNDII
ncbi:pyridoxal phosphate-dependent aminotransferase [Microbulbifer sp.]|uniref:pyridoxal phosphate-dependent aminotransferase n=1 Tax=Microbulbifer sp. TaxID=1908541 RepID=UPI0025844EA1|nr:pyridoxal phosphate-dependent aminotransferase [Microbulbifer sp.]